MQKLIKLMQQLRDPETGCPWDQAQDHTSLLPYLIEESYELVEAIQSGDSDHIKEELGDVLFQLVFHSQIATEAGQFGFQEVIDGIVEKMIRRHPHVYERAVFETEVQRKTAWEQIKRSEKERNSESNKQPETNFFTNVSRSLPTLMRAEKLQKRAANVGFDWPDYTSIVDKIEEELGEVVEVLEQGESQARLKEEIGDLLFAVTNLARHVGVDSETALVEGNHKFSRRFSSVISRLGERGIKPQDATLDEMDFIWDEIKQQEPGSG